jgi:hypothetical protein
MALELDAGDMDSQIQDKVDAYRNNPAALQQRYQMNQDLLDLLALQKIKSEKDTAKKQLALSMAQNPQTVKQQREAQLVEDTKKELTERVGGVMALRNAQQKNNLSRVAAGQRPAVRTPVAQQGVASQPTPNMARMAKGGIVSFANGEEVEEAETQEEYEARVERADELLALAGTNRQEFAAMPQKDKDMIIQTIQEKRALRRLGKNVLQMPIAAVDDLTSLPANVMDKIGGPLGRATGVLSPTTQLRGEEVGVVPSIRQTLGDIGNLRKPVTMASLQPGEYDPALASDAGVPMLNEVNPRASDGSDISAPPPPAPAAVPTNQGATVPSAEQMIAGVNALQKSLGGGSIAYQDPTKTQAGIANEAMRQKLADITMQQAQLNAGQERSKMQEGVGALFDRSGVAAKNQQIMDALRERDAQRTRANPFAYLRGGGGFGAVNRAFERARRADETMFDTALRDSIRAKRSGMTDDFKIAEQQRISGDATEKNITNLKSEGMRASQALITQRSKELSDVAKGYLDADKANLTEEAAKRRDAVGLMIARSGDAVKTEVANLQAQVQTRRNDIEEMKVEDMSVARKEKLLAEVQNMIAKVQSKYTEIIANAVASHPSMIGLEDEEAAKQRKIISQPYLVQQQQTVKDLAKTARRLRGVLTGGNFEVINRSP